MARLVGAYIGDSDEGSNMKCNWQLNGEMGHEISSYCCTLSLTSYFRLLNPEQQQHDSPAVLQQRHCLALHVPAPLQQPLR